MIKCRAFSDFMDQRDVLRTRWGFSSRLWSEEFVLRGCEWSGEITTVLLHENYPLSRQNLN